jgi:alanine racemase
MRAATAAIDLTALRHNLAEVRRRVLGSKIMAVVKANAYGHGAGRVLPALAGADMLGVACIEEALALRDAGASQPILLLEGVFEADELPLCARHDFEIAVHEPGQVRMLEQVRLERPLATWLKIDSGMGRLGFRPDAAGTMWQRLAGCAAVAPGIRLMSHFASADEPGDEGTAHQLAQLAAIDLPGERSFANSAGVIGWPEAHADWVRPGIMLYGVSPVAGHTGPEAELRPVMTLKTKLIAVKEHRRGQPVGYGATWRAEQDTRIGIAAIGYGDGYPRHAPSGTPVLVNGKTATLAGRVSMDMLALDLGAESEARVGDPVLLWGVGLPVEVIARHAGTIGYELLCGITGRVHVEIMNGEGTAAPEPVSHPP